MNQVTGHTPARRSSRIEGLDLLWDERALEPRPWTRLHAQWAKELAETLPPGPLIELCCGVGHIGLLAARETGRQAVLVDVDAVACDYARDNAGRAGLTSTVRIIEHRIDGGVIPGVPRPVALVLADPPYLPTAEADGWPDDPRLAIDGGDDGLELVSVVLRTAAAHLLPGGACLLQVRGARQADVVAKRLEGDWFDIPLAHADVRIFDADRAIQLVRRTS